MTDWVDLDRELANWAADGRTATLWWRDDDAIEPTPQLERMLNLSDRYLVPLALAVVPRPATSALAERIGRAKTTHALQHGWCHRNHAPPGAKAAEFGAHREPETMLAEAREGFSRLASFPRFSPIFVPPWNRIDPALLTGLREIGLRGLSGYGPRDEREPIAGFTVANTHADIVAWKTSRGFVGLEKILLELIGHLRARRTGVADVGEPTGLLTHHLVHDEGCWTFIEALLARTTGASAVCWLAPPQVFAIESATGAGA